MTAAIAVLLLVSLQRFAELLWARRNTAELRRRGAIEVGAEHYPVMIALHACWLGGLWIFGWDRLLNPYWLALFLVLQLARLWILATLGNRWTTRVMVLPEAPLVRSGPYRFFSHPNYAIVIGEVFALPMAFGLVYYALLFSAFNAAMLYVRIRVENAALAR